ncbi:zinc ribbon domain-containing protein [Thermogemmatispora carboxidivorans]|uniref:zinc ribbon domain-containing protein n=1 Tax=Thermogemmatispora carboxidivorans TaxID=1382306 RepID=UPI0012DF4F8A|nr:zinc ribbon domain-containing protein [Thermogemmatispora carboxidivorans]
MNAQSLSLILGATPSGGGLLTTLQNALGFIISFFLAFFFVFWISLIIWTFRDIRSRSQDLATQVIATLLVAVFNVGGLLIYLILRPRQTLAEIYERQLEEESLLAEMTERQTCTNCHARVESDFQICPSCGQKLKRPCPKCERLLELRWSFCPYCATNLMAMPMQGMPSVPGVSAVPGVPSMPGVAGMPANQPPGVPMSGPLGGNRF